jgi:hypothetical protein
MLAVLAISLAQSGASSPALQKAQPDARAASVLQPSGMDPSKIPAAADLLAKEPAASSSATKSAAHLAKDAKAAADAKAAEPASSSATKSPAHVAKDAKAAADERRAADKAASEARRADAKKDHEARTSTGKTHPTTAPNKVDKNLDIPKAKVMGGGGHEPKAVSVVTAIMLLSSLTLACCVFYLVNFHKATIVNHTWSAISVTICIFCAVLIFNASNGLTTWLLGRYDDGVASPPTEHEKDYGKDSAYPAPGQQGHQQQGHQQQDHQQEEEPHKQWRSVMWSMGGGGDTAAPAGPGPPPDGYIFMLAFIQFVVWYCIFGVAMIYFAGVKRLPWDKKEVSHDTKHINSKAGCMLLAHVAGFAAINCFGILMRMDPFETSPGLAFLSVLIACTIVLLMVTAYRAIRHKFATGGTVDDQHLLDEEAEEGGEDIMALLASFLVVQVFRYKLTNILPDGHGGESSYDIVTHMGSDHHNLLFQVLPLLAFGYTSALLCGAVVFVNAMSTPLTKFLSGHKAQQGVRMLTMTCAMVHCWALYFAGVWVMAASDLAEYIDVYEDSALLKVILACGLTIYAFILIFALEKLASLEATGPKADQAIYTVMGSLGILVGFTWEQAFERSVSTVVQANPSAPEPLLKAGLALFLVGMVLPAWRMYIILHTMKHSTEHMADEDYEHGKKLPVPEAKPCAQEQAILEKHGVAA